MLPVDVLETSLQKPPVNLPSVSMFLPTVVPLQPVMLGQSVLFMIPVTVLTPGRVTGELPNLEPPNQAFSAKNGCVAQKPWVRVTPLPVFSKVQVTVSPLYRLMVAFAVGRSPRPVLPP